MWNPILPALNNLHTSSDFRIGKNGFTYPRGAKLKFQEDRFAKNLEMGRSTSKRAVRWEAYERHRLPLCNVSSSWWKREDAGIRLGAQTMVPTPFPFLRQGKNTWPGRIYALKRHSSITQLMDHGGWLPDLCGRSSLQQGLSNHLTGFNSWALGFWNRKKVILNYDLLISDSP